MADLMGLAMASEYNDRDKEEGATGQRETSNSYLHGYRIMGGHEHCEGVLCKSIRW